MAKNKKKKSNHTSLKLVLVLTIIVCVASFLAVVAANALLPSHNDTSTPSKEPNAFEKSLIKVTTADPGDIEPDRKQSGNDSQPTSQSNQAPAQPQQSNKGSLPDHWWDQYLTSPSSSPMPSFSPSPTPSPTYAPPATSCTYVTVSGSSKSHYACPYGSYPPCSPYKAIAPYDYTKNLYECG